MMFLDPSVLRLCGIILAIAVALQVYLWRKSQTNRQRFAWIESTLRILTLCSISLALAGPYFEHSIDRARALVLVDVSDSMDEAISDSLIDRLREFQTGGVNLDVIPFAKQTASVLTPLSDISSFRNLKTSWSRLDIGTTNIEQALTSVAERGSGGVLLISDGYETQGASSHSAPILSQGGIKIFPLAPKNSQNAKTEFTISNLHAPMVAPAQKSVDVRVSIKNSSNHETAGTIEIKHDGKVILTKHIEVGAEAESLIVAQSDPSAEGIKEITATLKPDDKSLPPSTQTVFVSGEAREKILLMNGTVEDERFLHQVLSNQSYQLKSVQPGEQKGVPDLTEYSAVIFNNIAQNQLPSGTDRAIERYVKDGGGFIMIGGDHSFGLGGYRDTPIADVLPVELVPPQTQKKRLNVAVELVIDKSRSMADNNKIEFAKDAAREVVRNLKDDDYIGIFGFDAAPFEVVRMGQVGTIRDEATDRVSRLFPTGQTNLMPAIDEARRRLTAVSAGRKHLIILTDGRLPDGGPYYVEIVKQMRLLGITVSTVLVGDDDSGLLESMAEQGGGSYYQTMDPRALPKIFISDLKVSTGEQTLKEQQEFIVRRGPSANRSTDIQAFPTLRGYVETKERSRANLELVTMAQDKAEPLLATWEYGKGKSLAFTSDANGRWSSMWVQWPGFQRFWSDMLDAVRPEQQQGNQEQVRFDLRYYLEGSNLILDMTVFSNDQGKNLSADIVLPNGEHRQVGFSAISRGHYRAALSPIAAGKYELKPLFGSQKLTPVAFELSGELFGEKKGKGFDLTTLEFLASSTAGKVNTTIDDIRSQTYKEIKKTDLTWVFLLLAAILMISEIFKREVFRTRLLSLKRSRSNSKFNLRQIFSAAKQ